MVFSCVVSEENNVLFELGLVYATFHYALLNSFYASTAKYMKWLIN